MNFTLNSKQIQLKRKLNNSCNNESLAIKKFFNDESLVIKKNKLQKLTTSSNANLIFKRIKKKLEFKKMILYHNLYLGPVFIFKIITVSINYYLIVIIME